MRSVRQRPTYEVAGAVARATGLVTSLWHSRERQLRLHSITMADSSPYDAAMGWFDRLLGRRRSAEAAGRPSDSLAITVSEGDTDLEVVGEASYQDWLRDLSASEPG